MSYSKQDNRKKYIFWGIALVALLLIIGFLIYSQVDNSLTAEDHRYIQKFLEDGNVKPLSAKSSYKETIKYITGIQRSVIKRTSTRSGLPVGFSREPKDVYLSRTGACYDRSRVIEKILRAVGFKTRHISVYSTGKTGSIIESLLTPRGSSHAFTEVLTRKGWLVVDSNDTWISLDIKGNPVSIKKLRKYRGSIKWLDEEGFQRINNIYRQSFIYIYGLYSRHGKFYPPFNFVPDINWREFLYNF